MPSHVPVQISPESRIEEILPLFRTYQGLYSQFVAATEDQTRTFLAELLRDPQSGVMMIAEVEARIVGFATAFVTVSGVLASKMFHLGDLYVLPEFRGQQIGKHLVEAVRLEAARRNIPLVRWLSVASNDRLNAWYEKLGATSHDFKLFIADARDG